MPPLVPPLPPLKRLSPPPARSTFLFGPRGTGKSTYAKQCFPDAVMLDLRSGPIARALAAEPERLHETLDAAPANRWVVIDEVQRVPAILDAVHQRMDREPERRFLLTGSSARSLHRAGVNLLGGRAGRRIMSPFLAAELGTAFCLTVAQRIGLLPVIWTADSPEQALADYATVAVFDEVRAEARVRQIDGFARALEQLALSHASVISPTAIAQLAAVKKSTVVDWIDVLESMFLIARVPVFSTRPSRRALAAQPKLYFADTGIAAAFRPTEHTRAAPDAIGASREGLVYQHLAAWCAAARDARLTTWRTTGGVEVDFVVESSDGLVAIEVKSGHTLRPADRRGLLAFHDEFPDARLIVLADSPLQQQQGPITIFPIAEFLLGIVPGAPLPA
ncbi:MAG: ATP-binding protein [Gemmatimonas sp.]